MTAFWWLYVGVAPLLQAGENTAVSYQDSILTVAEGMATDTARLSYLERMAYFYQYAPLDSIFAIGLYAESCRQGDVQYEEKGAYYMAGCFDRRHEPDSLAYWVGKLKSLAEKSENYDYYLERKAAISRAQASKRWIEKAVYTAQEALKESRIYRSRNGIIAAYNSLGCAYAVSSRSHEALELLLKAHSLFAGEVKPALRLDVLSRIVTQYGNSGSDSLKMPYLEEMDGILQEILAREPGLRHNYANMLVDVEIKYILHYVHISELHKAKEHILKATALLDSHVDPVYWLNIQFGQLQYYFKNKEYDKSIALVDSVTPVVLKDYVYAFSHLINHKVMTLQAKGEIDEAIHTRKYLIRTQDSLNNAFSANQLKQMKELYHINELLMEKQKISNMNLINIFVFLIVLSVLIFLFYLYTRRLSERIVIAEKAAVEAAGRAESDNEAKERLRTEISYDVRTPLNAVVGFAELLSGKNEALDETSQREYCGILQENAGQLLEYVNNILELSRLESGKLKYKEEKCDLIELCHEAILIANHAENNVVRPRLAASPEKARVTTDRAAFLNLMKSFLILNKDKARKTYEVVLCVEKKEGQDILTFEVLNTPLAEENSENKVALIRNEINRYFIKYFGGTYEKYPQGEKGPRIVFTYPLNR